MISACDGTSERPLLLNAAEIEHHPLPLSLRFGRGCCAGSGWSVDRILAQIWIGLGAEFEEFCADSVASTKLALFHQSMGLEDHEETVHCAFVESNSRC